MGNRFFRPQALSLAQQKLAMQCYFPDFATHSKRNEIIWIGCLRPSEMSSLYKIKIAYRLPRRPKVWVLDPPLSKRSDSEDIPHLYPSNNLCLYLPWGGEWSRNMFIAKTIIPWTSLYLYFYEIWQITGEWKGGGVHPGNDEPEM